MARRTPARCLAGLATLALSAAIVPGCFEVAGYDDFTFRDSIHERLSATQPTDKLDLLLVVDNSNDLESVQAVLSETFIVFFDRLGWRVDGVDNNMRRDFFGPDGDTGWNLQRLRTIVSTEKPQ